MKMQGPPGSPRLPSESAGSGAGGRQKESASDDLFTCVFLEDRTVCLVLAAWQKGRQSKGKQLIKPTTLEMPPQAGTVLRSVCIPPCQVQSRTLAAVTTQGPEEATAASVQGVGGGTGPVRWVISTL